MIKNPLYRRDQVGPPAAVSMREYPPRVKPLRMSPEIERVVVQIGMEKIVKQPW